MTTITSRDAAHEANERQRAKAAAAREALVEDVVFLLSTSEDPTLIARRVGSPNLEALMLRLRRAGRRDLTAVLAERNKAWRSTFDDKPREFYT